MSDIEFRLATQRTLAAQHARIAELEGEVHHLRQAIYDSMRGLCPFCTQAIFVDRRAVNVEPGRFHEKCDAGHKETCAVRRQHRCPKCGEVHGHAEESPP